MCLVGVLVIGGDDMQVEFGFWIVLIQYYVYVWWQLGVIGFVELYVFEDFVVGVVDLDVVGVVVECIGVDEVFGVVGIERERIVVDYQVLGVFGVDQFVQVFFDQVVVVLVVVIDGWSWIGDMWGIGLFEQVGIVLVCCWIIQVY